MKSNQLPLLNGLFQSSIDVNVVYTHTLANVDDNWTTVGTFNQRIWEREREREIARAKGREERERARAKKRKERKR